MTAQDDTEEVSNSQTNGLMSLLIPTVQGLTSRQLLSALWGPSQSILERRTQPRSGSMEGGPPFGASGAPAPSTELSASLAQLLAANSTALTYGDERAISKRIVTSAEEIAGSIRTERIRQARTSFNAALFLAIIGVLLIFVGALLVIAGIETAGVLTAVASAVPQAMAVLLFRLNKQANDRLDKVNNDLERLGRFRLTMDLVDSISDARSKDRAIGQAIRSLHSG